MLSLTATQVSDALDRLLRDAKAMTLLAEQDYVRIPVAHEVSAIVPIDDVDLALALPVMSFVEFRQHFRREKGGAEYRVITCDGRTVDVKRIR